jgi:hypothetical protein
MSKFSATEYAAFLQMYETISNKAEILIDKCKRIPLGYSHMVDGFDIDRIRIDATEGIVLDLETSVGCRGYYEDYTETLKFSPERFLSASIEELVEDVRKVSEAQAAAIKKREEESAQAQARYREEQDRAKFEELKKKFEKKA